MLMASQNCYTKDFAGTVLQHFEKKSEKSSSFLQGIWHTKKQLSKNKNVREENVKDNYENNLTETHTPCIQNSVSPFNELETCSENIDFFDSSEREIGKELEEEYDDNDATDYFDSDDEYQSSISKTPREEHISFLYGGDQFSGYETDGRYSKGMEQIKNMPVFMKSIQKFALDNDFEIWNGQADGNCMFRSIADQLTINGYFGLNPEQLRRMAIEYLRENPLQHDGCPIESFLSTEKWDEYLTRMSNSMEWSDHIMLKAIVDALHLDVTVFNVFRDDVRHTVVKSSRKNVPMKELSIYLGHLGEFHYISLRPKQWRKLWPYRALVHRMLFWSERNTSRTDSTQIKEKCASLENMKFITEARLEDQFSSLQLTANSAEQMDKGENDQRSLIQKQSFLSFFNTFGLDDIQIEDSNDSLQCLIEDPLHVDTLTGIPLPHLGLFIRHVFAKEMIIEYSLLTRPKVIQEQLFQYIGTFAVGDNVALKDLSQERKQHRFQFKFTTKDCTIAAIQEEVSILFEHCSIQGDSVSVLHADFCDTHPGYCRLRPLKTHSIFPTRQVPDHYGEMFLSKPDLPSGIRIPPGTRKCYPGFVCCTFPPVAREWGQRKRKFNWPSAILVEKILTGGTCTLIPKCHSASLHPDIEWKLDFSMAYSLIFSLGLSNFQIDGYFVLKIIIQEMNLNIPKRLKRKHIISVFLNACEDIPQYKWKTNFAGCLLYTLSLLNKCLKRKFLPDYFVASNNIIDYYSDDEIKTLCVYMEAIRVFPTMTISFIAEKYGYRFGAYFDKYVSKDCPAFLKSRDLSNALMKTFIPITYGVSRFFARLGFYRTAYRLIQDIYEDMLLTPSPAENVGVNKPSFVEFFAEALHKFKQKTSKGILAQIFDMDHKSDFVARFTRSKTVGEVVPWEVDNKLAWMEMPEVSTRDFSSMASFFYDLSCSQYRKQNVVLASIAIDTAILCLRRAISEESINEDEIEDMELKREIMAQQSTRRKNLKLRLFDFYVHVYYISYLNATMIPISTYMRAVEELSEEFPERYEVVAQMYYYIRREDKGREYQRKFDEYFTERNRDGLALY